MGMDLISRRRFFQWNNVAWRTVLDIGIQHGWVPMGTGPCRGVRKRDWVGDYFSNDGQLFYARDAKRLADALRTFLNQKRRRLPRRRKNEAWFWSPAGKRALADFIRFCRKGSFRIH